MNIKESLSELKKDILFFLDLQKHDIETMRQEAHTPEKIAPVCISGERNSPRMKLRK